MRPILQIWWYTSTMLTTWKTFEWLKQVNCKKRHWCRATNVKDFVVCGGQHTKCRINMSSNTHADCQKIALGTIDVLWGENSSIRLWLEPKLSHLNIKWMSCENQALDKCGIKIKRSDALGIASVMTLRRLGDNPLPEPMLTPFTDAYMRHKGNLS